MLLLFVPDTLIQSTVSERSAKCLRMTKQYFWMNRKPFTPLKNFTITFKVYFPVRVSLTHKEGVARQSRLKQKSAMWMNIFVFAPSQKSAAVQREKESAEAAEECDRLHSLLTCTGEWVGNWEEDWVVEWSICEKFNDEKIMLYGRDLWPIWKCIGQSIKSFNAKNNFW